MYKKLVSHWLSNFCEKDILLSAAQFAYRNCLGCTDALLTLSHHFQKSLDAGMESYIVQLDFSAAFARVSQSGLLFKLKSISVGGRMLSICTEFLSDRSQRVMVDSAASEWIPIISGVPQRSVLVFFCLLYIPAKCLSLLRTDYLPMQMTTLLAVVRKPADRPLLLSP